MCGWLLRTRGWSCRATERQNLLRVIRIWFGVVVCVGTCPVLFAQQAKAPTLGEVLQRLEANLNHYDAGVPSVFCDERLVSSRTAPHEQGLSKITDSVFQLQRVPRGSGATMLLESREVRSVDGRPAGSQAVGIPALLTGIFEGGLAVVSVDQTSCMNYKLEGAKRPGQDIVVRFATLLTRSNTADCFLQEKSKGRVVIDAAAMQVKRLEIDTPRHTIVEGDEYTSAEIGRRELSVDYAPVALGSETFWMPSAVTMRTTSGSDFDQTVWSFEATYRNYHRLEVKSRILDKPE